MPIYRGSYFHIVALNICFPVTERRLSAAAKSVLPGPTCRERFVVPVFPPGLGPLNAVGYGDVPSDLSYLNTGAVPT